MAKEHKEKSGIDNASGDRNLGSTIGSSSDEFEHLDSKSSSGIDDQKVTRSDNECELELPNLLDNLLVNINNRAPKTYEEVCQKSYDIYSRVQQWRNQIITLFPLSDFITSDQRNIEIGEFSRDYLDLIQLYANGLSSDDTDEISRINTIFRTWSFCDILYFSGPVSQLNLSKLCDWINVFYNNDESNNNNNENENRIDWDYIRRKLLRGDKHTVLHLLINYTNTKECLLIDELNKVIELIKSIPELTVDDNGLKTIWDKKWASWNQKATNLWVELHNSNIGNQDDDQLISELLFTLGILSGEQDAISEAGTFLEKCTGTLLYVDPSLHNNNLMTIANFYYQPEEEDGDQIINMCYALLVGDFDMFIDLMDDDIWFQTHLGYLLLLSGQLPTIMNDTNENSNNINNTSITEESVTEPIYYVMEQYSNMIAEKYKMWTESMEYLMACKPNKEIWIEKLFDLPSFPSKNIEFLITLVEFCKKNKLSHVERTLYKIIAQNYETKEDYVNAAINYGLAEDIDSLDIMANKLLELYLTKGILQDVVTKNDLKILDDSKSYYFFRVYHEFKAHLNNDRLDDAYKKLMGLFTLLDSNSKYIAVLLVDSIQLQKDCRRMSEQNTQELFQQLNLIRKDPAQQSFISTYYNRCHPSSQPLNSDIIIARIHERLTFNLNVITLQL
ncbi:nucleoporin Nup85-like protein [Cunninghamella echinulata]|nr:nucleoporin Nup85-like protein [Cunninghamella echinulata]